MEPPTKKDTAGFSDRIKMLRGNMAREEFGARIGVSVRTVQRWELGQDYPKGRDLLRLCEIFDVGADWLLFGVLGAPEMARDSSFVEVGLAKGVQLLAKIYDSEDQVLVRAIESNLLAFSQAADNQRMIKGQSERIKKLEEECETMRQRLEALEARLESGAMGCEGGAALGSTAKVVSGGG